MEAANANLMKNRSDPMNFHGEEVTNGGERSLKNGGLW